MSEPKPKTTPKPEAESQQDSAQAKDQVPDQVPSELHKRLEALQANCQQLREYEEQLSDYKPNPYAQDQTWVDLYGLKVAQFDLATTKQEFAKLQERAKLQELKAPEKPVKAEDLIDLDTRKEGHIDQFVQDSIAALEDIARRHGLPEDLPRNIENVTEAIATDGADLIEEVAAMREQADESGNQDLRASIDQYDAALHKLVPHESFDDYSGVNTDYDDDYDENADDDDDDDDDGDDNER